MNVAKKVSLAGLVGFALAAPQIFAQTVPTRDPAQAVPAPPAPPALVKPEPPADVQQMVRRFQLEREALMKQLKTASDEERKRILGQLQEMREQNRRMLEDLRQQARDQADKMRERFGNSKMNRVVNEGVGPGPTHGRPK
jgi:vacuolar-type H+-ATPase subunit H